MEGDVSTLDKRFKKVTFEDYDFINEYLIKYPAENCDFNICTIFTWGLHFELEFTIFDMRLILFNPYYGYMLFPIGENLTAEELYQINNCCEKIHKKVEIMVVPEWYINLNPNLTDYFTFYNDIDCNDYVYNTDSLVNLSGKKLAKKKNLISQFHRLYPNWRIEYIKDTDKDEISDFTDYWKSIHLEQDDFLDIEVSALKLSLTNWNLLPNEGIKLYVDDKLVAFAIWSQQNEEMATVHYEKYDPHIKGSGQVINHETALILNKKYKYINREQDMGLDGIRQAKRSYQPIRMVPYYRLKSK